MLRLAGQGWLECVHSLFPQDQKHFRIMVIRIAVWQLPAPAVLEEMNLFAFAIPVGLIMVGSVLEMHRPMLKRADSL